jgi:transcriptional regulator with XRE-family HTH domain
MGAVIRRERRERGLTLKALAERSALSVVYLGEIERGKKYPSAQVLEQLAKALELDLAELLELVADELRGMTLPSTTSAMGFTLPRAGDPAPRATVRRLVQMLEPHEAATMAELGAFFLARRTGKSEAE